MVPSTTPAVFLQDCQNQTTKQLSAKLMISVLQKANEPSHQYYTKD